MLTSLLVLAGNAGVAEGFAGGVFPSRWSSGTIDASGASAATGPLLRWNSAASGVERRSSSNTATRMTVSEGAVSSKQTFDFDSWAKVWGAAEGTRALVPACAGVGAAVM